MLLIVSGVEHNRELTMPLMLRSCGSNLARRAAKAVVKVETDILKSLAFWARPEKVSHLCRLSGMTRNDGIWSTLFRLFMGDAVGFRDFRVSLMRRVNLLYGTLEQWPSH